MSLLVDEAIWPWRGRRWAHLVSDAHLDELHDLAHRLGLPYLAFQGDHYDVHEDLRLAAIEAGAVPTPGREIVRALRAAGLRQRATPSWEWTDRDRLGRVADAAPVAAREVVARLGPRRGSTGGEGFEVLAEELDALSRLAPLDEVGRAEGESETLLLVTARATVDPRALRAGLEPRSGGIRVHRTTGERGTYVEVTFPRTV